MRLKISNDLLLAEINSLGAELVSLRSLQKPVEFLWQGDPKYWARRAPILFPIVGALPNNRYTLNGKTYEMTQHGFARDSNFELVDSTPSNSTWVLRENQQTLSIYPFSFEIVTSYQLNGNALSIGHQVCNTGRETMWFSIGEHPGFNCPLFKNESMEDYSLVFDKEETLDRGFLVNSLLNHEKIIPLSRSLFEKKAIILENYRSESISLVGKNHPRRVTVTFAGYPYLGIWSPPNGAPLVCIEPWHGVASPERIDSDLTHKPGILSLGAGKKFICGYKIIVV
jgi:galactose mutarotase-like enzyme